MDRRIFLEVASGGIAACAVASAVEASTLGGNYKAVLFDGFPVFDPRPIAQLTEKLYPGNGAAIVNAWRTRQFEYQWLRSLAGHYVDFLETTRGSLEFAAKQLQIEITAPNRDALLAAWTQLTPWPDAADAIETLRSAGLRLGFLSNMTASMLSSGLKNAGLEDRFELVLSTDRVRTYKPDRRAYQMGVEALKLSKEEILFVALAGWDVAGAKWFGYPTFWVNRLDSPMEELGVVADGTGPDLQALIDFVLPNA